MRIKTLEVSAPFKYLWLKHVTGVDLSVHCARCLKGRYSKAVNAETKFAENIELGEGVWYLCGVSAPYRWGNNFHLAACHCPGGSVEVERNGVRVVLEDAELLPISPGFIDSSDPNAGRREFATCRNWQFANWLAKSSLI
jgi:hypothetical protein